MAHRLCRLLVFLLPLIFLAIATPAEAQTGIPPTATPVPSVTPTPGVIETCFDDGLSACAPKIWHEYGIGGIVVLSIIALIAYFLSPIGEKLRGKVGDWFSMLISRHQPELPLEDRLPEEYLDELDQALEQQSIDPVVALSDYLRRLEEGAELRPTEAEKFVPLSGDLALESIKPRIGFAPLPEGGSKEAIFTEQATFPDLAEALQVVDKRTGLPYPAFALLGEPGAGKSTLLRKLARDVLKQYRENTSLPLPIFVSLGKHRRGKPIDFLREHWRRYVRVGRFDDALAAGRVWLFADGLNEMERIGYNVRVGHWREFLHQHVTSGHNRAVVACREADYDKGLWLPRLNIHHMGVEQIQEFLQKYAPARAKTIWEQIEKDAREARGDLYRLAQVPFWLVIMTEVSAGGDLPHDRAELMGRLVQRWLDYESNRDGGCKALAAKTVRGAFLENLIRLAWRGLARGQNYEFVEQSAEAILKKDMPGLNGRDALKAACSCSLLVKSHDAVKFYHQLLQEYFASHELARRFKRGERLARLWRIVWRDWKFVRSSWDPLPDPPSTFWEEATVLAAGMLNSDEAERLTLAVLRHNPPLAARGVIESGAEMGEAIQKAVANRLRAQIENPRQRLAARLAAGKALGRLGDDRILAGWGKAALPSKKVVDFIEPSWVEIPAGTFQMGSGKKDKMAYADESPAHPVTISRGYKIARFPVTVAEYRCFMDAGGYENDDYWLDEISRRWRDGGFKFEESWQAYLHREERKNLEAALPQWEREVKTGRRDPNDLEGLRNYLQMPEDALEEQWKNLEAQKRDETGRANRPWLWDEPRYIISNQPVIGISWFEARAYALWLTGLLRQARRISDEVQASLPTEAEWEYAARGADGRLWPWGNRWKKDVCNSQEGRVYFPSPVGIYPLNLSPFGALDMAGNVWEWCADWYAEDTYEKRKDMEVVDPPGPETGTLRVLRGGSFDCDRGCARCAYRSGNYPDDFVRNLGFRVVLSPIIKSEL